MHHSYSCTAAALSALPGIAPHELIVIGDRIFTDVVLGHRLAHPRMPTAPVVHSSRLAPAQLGSRGAGPYASVGEGGESARAPLTVWVRESMAMRWVEKWLVHLVEGWCKGHANAGNAVY